MSTQNLARLLLVQVIPGQNTLTSPLSGWIGVEEATQLLSMELSSRQLAGWQVEQKSETRWYTRAAGQLDVLTMEVSGK